MNALLELTSNFNIKSAFKVGVSDEILECFCCGKLNLKRTVVLRDDDGQYSFYGSSCARLAGKAGIKGKVSAAAPTIEVIEEIVDGDLYKIILEAEIKNARLFIFNPHSQAWIEKTNTHGSIVLLSLHGQSGQIYSAYKKMLNF